MTFRRLLKDGATGFYYDGRGGWTANHKDAHSFPDSISAVRQAVLLGNKNLHFVLKFPDERMDVVHPLPDSPAPPRLPGKELLVGLLPVLVSASRALR